MTPRHHARPVVRTGSAVRTGTLAALFTSAALSLHAQPTPAPSAVPVDPAEEPIEMMEFFVQERGVSRATSSVTPEDAKNALPGMSVERLLAKMPGVNIRSTDPFGFYEFGNDIRVRSFGIAALAVTIDDIPMGNNNPRYGTPAGRVVDGENMASITVSQGTGDVTTPAYEVLGGAIKYYTVDPDPVMGAHLKFSVGDFDHVRYFAKFNTGEILPGLTAYVSTSQLNFKSAGIIEDSEGRKLEAKIRYVLPKATLKFAYTWNDRDDYDTRSVQWDRWMALETGDPFAGYGVASMYGSAEQNNLRLFAANGYTSYMPDTMPALVAGTPGATGSLGGSLQGNYSDHGRVLGAHSYLGTNESLGDGIYNNYYKYYRNGRMDSLFRGSADVTVSESITLRGSSYYHDRHNYGTFPVLRSDARTQVVNSYNALNNPNKILRTDIYPRWAYRNAAGDLVPIGTPGAVPVGFVDTNANGAFDIGEKLNPSLTATAPGEFSSGHALVTPTSTTLANASSGIPGATARDEDFGGERFGFYLKGSWTAGFNTLTVGGWYEDDQQMAFRPTYNLSGAQANGEFLYDQIIFNNYDQNFGTYTTILFIEDVMKFFQDAFTVTLGAKSVSIDKEAYGILFTQNYWKPLGQQRVHRFKEYEDNFLPQIGLGYKLTGEIEVFANYAENLASPPNNVIANVDFNESLRPERADNYDVGVRYVGDSFGATLALFYNKYEDRILSVAFTEEELAARGLRGVTGATQFRNVGGIDSTGAELAWDWRTPVKGLRLNGSFAYQQSEFSDDIAVTYQLFMASATDPRAKFYQPFEPNPNFNSSAVESTTNLRYIRAWELQEGRSQGNTPEFTAKADLAYTWRNVEATFGGEFYDSVYVNTLNTEEIPSWTSFTAGLRVAGPKGGKLEGFTAGVLVQNVFDKYIWRANSYTGSFNGSVIADYGRNIVFTVEAKF